MSDEGRMRVIEFRGEAYVCRSDLLEEINQAARGMASVHDRACAENLVRWLVDATRSEP